MARRDTRSRFKLKCLLAKPQATREAEEYVPECRTKRVSPLEAFDVSLRRHSVCSAGTVKEAHENIGFRAHMHEGCCAYNRVACRALKEGATHLDVLNLSFDSLP